MPFDKLVDKAIAGTREAASKAKKTTEQALDTGKEKLREITMRFLAEINGLKPILTECGFTMSDIKLTFPVPIEVNIIIEQTEQGKRTLEQILIEDEGKTGDEGRLTGLQKAIIRSMVKTNEVLQVTDKYGYTFRVYEITLTTPPKVTLHLVPKISQIDTGQSTQPNSNLSIVQDGQLGTLEA